MQHEFGGSTVASLKSHQLLGLDSALRLMSDCEEKDFFCESWISPGRKRKKNSRKDEKYVKHKKINTMKTDQSFQKKKKKKNSKFKGAMEGRKEKKKERKQKKNKLTVGLDERIILTQGYSGASGPVAKLKPESSHPCSIEKLKPDHLSQDSKKKKKKKKTVMFDLSPAYICVKRPKFVSSSPKDNILAQKEPERDSENCSQVTMTGHSQSQPHDNELQNTSDDINSQDLFITQKMFRISPSDPSSGEASDKGVITIPQPEKGLDSSGVQIKHHDGLYTCLQDSFFHQHQKKVSGPVHVKSSVVNPCLDIAKSKKHTCTSRQKSPPCPLNTNEPSLLLQMSKASISTQTENFFTTELSSYHSFCRKRGLTICSENLKPLDLSLPQRARKDHMRCLSVEVPGIEVKDDEKKCTDQKPSSLPDEMRGNGRKYPDLHPICSSVMKAVEVKKEPYGRLRWSVRAQVKDKTTPSPQSESESKIADIMTSSEDEPLSSTGKLDLTQVKVVQTRLNESFFFKTKGEEKSLRPMSPLMKLTQGRAMKSRKGPLRSLGRMEMKIS